MQLSHATSKDTILARATLLTFGDSLDHTTSYPLADMVSSANRWVQKVGTWIWQSSGTWEWDDSNQTDLPSATSTMVASQQDYAIPTTVVELMRVEVKDSAGNWRKLRQIDQTEISIALTEYEETAGLPHSYDVRANSIFLYPAPSAASTTLTSGLRIYFAREATTFTVPASYTTADTTQPGFDEDFHDIICQGIAYDYLSSNDYDRSDKVFARIQTQRAELQAHQGLKNKDKKPKISPKKENYK